MRATAPTRGSGVNIRLIPFVFMAGLPVSFVMLPAGAGQPSRLCQSKPLRQATIQFVIGPTWMSEIVSSLHACTSTL